MKLLPWISITLLSCTFLYGEIESYSSEDTCCTEWEYDPSCECDHLLGCCVQALPPGPPLMPPFVADPRKVGMSAGWRFDDKVIEPEKRSSGAVSFGDYAGLVRWCNPFGYGGFLDIGIEGDVWAVFQHCRPSAALVNADYYIGIPVTYSFKDWAFRVRISHISSHLGDEFLLNNPGFDRRNPSAEYLDFFAQWWPNCDFRLYAGVGIIVFRDSSFKFRRLYAEYGFEYYLPWLKWCIPKSQVLGRLYTGAHIRTRADNNYNFDGTFVFGYEWARCRCDYKRVRVYLEYHDGYSLEGQFNRFRTNYGALVAYYGY